jgi:hypothetical protein
MDTSSNDVAVLLPVNHLLRDCNTSAPFLAGLQCTQCQAVFTDRRSACARCFSRDALDEHALAPQGQIIAFTVVRRSFPGIQVPYVSAVVSLDGGGDIKVNVINIDPDSEHLCIGLPVELVFKTAPYGDQHGNQYLMYYVQPRQAEYRQTSEGKENG